MEKLPIDKTWRIDPWLVAVVACFAIFAWVSWAKLVHPIFDTGAEIEMSARLLEGQALYRDLYTYYGPLAYYFNALALMLFGDRLEVFYLVGLGLGLVILLLSYRLVEQLTNPPWAALCAGYLIIYCAFNPGGLFNLVAPYSYGAVYGTVFCLLAFTALERYGQNGRLGWLAIAASLAGCAGLAKQEFGVAISVAVLVGVVVYPDRNFQTKSRHTIVAIAIALVWSFGPLALLSAEQTSWQQIFAALLPLSKARIFTDSGLLYFSPARTLKVWRDSLGSFLATALVVGSAMAIARAIMRDYWCIRDRQLRDLTELAIGLAIAWLSLFLLQIPLGSSRNIVTIAIAIVGGSGLVAIGWQSLRQQQGNAVKLTARNLSKMVASGLVAIAGIAIVRRMGVTFHPLGNLTWLLPLLVGWFAVRWRSLLRQPQAVLVWSLLTFSILLNSRFWFNLDFYGIYAVTAILLLFVLLYQLVLQLRVKVWNYLLIGLLIGGGTQIAKFSQYCYPISSDRGTMYVNRSELADAYNYAISYINNSGAKLVLTIPTGAILNFLSGTHSPSQETIFLPGVLPTAAAERQFVANMSQQPPDLIIYVDVPFHWLKPGYQTYAQFNPLVDKWIGDRYQLVHSSAKLVYDDRPWVLRIYAPKDRPLAHR
jgi:Dolichyl-phosphate-mannose-protein mannosyltransferase